MQTTGERRPAAGFLFYCRVPHRESLSVSPYRHHLGTTWIAIKLQLGVVAIPVSIFYRFALAGLVLFAGLLLLGSCRSWTGAGT